MSLLELIVSFLFSTLNGMDDALLILLLGSGLNLIYNLLEDDFKEMTMRFL